MAKPAPKSKTKKYFRRYRTCFIIGIVILSFQVLLIANFLSQNKSGESADVQSDEKNEKTPDHSTSHAAHSAASANKKAANNLTQIKLENLDFDLPCHITGREALSALNRAKTQKCKKIIANITCLSLENKLYPSKLETSCPSGNFKSRKPLGCFKDENGFRLLTGYFSVNKNDNSPAYCTRLCLQSGFPYAGVEYGSECFCGADEPPSSSKIADSSCNIKCTGEPQETCGGYFAINIFQTGIKKFVPQTANESSTRVTKPVRIVFLLTLNGRALRQVMRLIKLIYHKDHYYYIHVDVRQDYLFRELLPLERFPNVRLSRNRFATIWGGASLLAMLRSCMSELLNMKTWHWQYVLNLSESDYPVKTVEKLTSFLSENKDRNFVKSHGREVQRFIQKQGLDKTFVECETRMWRVGNRELPTGIQIDGGSDWISLSRKFVEYVASPTPDELVTGLLQVFKYTLLPAESFFHTVLRNSKFCNTYVDNNLHVTNWKRKLGCKCQYKHVVDWCGCSPNDFRPDDWTKILNTSPRPIYFARKFEPVINQAVILQLELWLFGLEKPSKEVTNLNSYWQSIYHYKDAGAAPDDAVMTLSNSVKRKSSKLAGNSSSCNVTFDKLLEVTSYYKDDAYKNTLFLFNTSHGPIEVSLKPVERLVVLLQSELTKNLVSMSVNTDYDQKEQVSRNVLRILSPYSEPVLVYNFDMHKTSKQYNLTCLWIDPIGSLRDVSGVSVDENSPVGYVKPNLKHPLLPGIWEVKVLHKTTLILQLSFLIIPMQFLYGSEIVGPQLSFLYSGLKQSSNFGDTYANFLPNVTDKGVLEQIVLENSYRTDDNLLEWIDSLVSMFYSVDKICSVDSDKIKPSGAVRVCARTSWSSFAPDPKSVIGNKVNESTGMFDVW